jgi:hypothetical protein
VGQSISPLNPVGISWPVYNFQPVLTVDRCTFCFGFYIWVLDFEILRKIQLRISNSSRSIIFS